MNTTVLARFGDIDSGTGPIIKDGQMIELSFSRWIVNSRPDCGEWRDSNDENEEGI